MRPFWSSSAIAIALALAPMTQAMAQAESDQGSQNESSSANASSSDDNDDSSVIIVTAQFREQSVQDVPLAISAIGAETLAEKGVTDIAAAGNLAPNVQFSSGAGNFGGMAAVSIRGVGQSDPHMAIEPGIGMYVDDVYFGVMTGAIFDLLDVDRVEVLRGPQGTLAGKNSIGGAVKLFSRRPGPDRDAYIEVGYGSRNSMLGRAATNVTLIDDLLYARFAVSARYSDGYVDRLDYACVTGNFTGGTRRTGTDCKLGEQGGKEVFSARGSLLWRPTDSIENLLIVDSARDRSQNPATKLSFSSRAWTAANDYFTEPREYTNYENYVSRPTGQSQAGIPYFLPAQTPVDAWGISNILTVDLSDNLSLTSITAFRASDSTFSSTMEASPASILDQVWRMEHEQFTQELRLNGQLGELADWTLGGYYYTADGYSSGRITIPGGLAPGGGGVNLDLLLDDPVETESKSLFLHTVWHLTAALNVTGAVRYTDDKKDFTFNRLDPNGSLHPTLGTLANLTVPYRGDRLDYRVGADYTWAPGFMTYAQVSTGYKGGGVNARPFINTQALPFLPETLTAYEAGFKGEFADRRVTLNAAAFLNKYDNFQATILRCDSISPFPGFPCTQTANVGSAEMKGAEAELSAEPVDGLKIDGSVGYLDFEYTSANPVTGIALTNTNVYTPEWTAAAGAQYEIELGASGSLTPRVDLSYRSSMEGGAANESANHIPGRALIGAKLTWRNADRDWQAELSVTNLTNEFYFDSTNGRPGAPYFAVVNLLGPPRTFMFTVRRNFD